MMFDYVESFTEKCLLVAMPKKNVKTETVAVVGQVVGDPVQIPVRSGFFRPQL